MPNAHKKCLSGQPLRHLRSLSVYCLSIGRQSVWFGPVDANCVSFFQSFFDLHPAVVYQARGDTSEGYRTIGHQLDRGLIIAAQRRHGDVQDIRPPIDKYIRRRRHSFQKVQVRDLVNRC